MSVGMGEWRWWVGSLRAAAGGAESEDSSSSFL